MFSFSHFPRVIPSVLGTLVLLSALGVFGTKGFAQQVSSPQAAPQLAGSLAGDERQDIDSQDPLDRELDAENASQRIVDEAVLNQQNLDGNLRAQAVSAPRDGDLTGDGRVTDGRPDVRLPSQFDLLPRAATRSLRRIQQRLRGQNFESDLFGFDHEPLGIRAGSFLVRPEINSEVLFTDNVFLTSRDRSFDEALQLRGRLDVVSDWSRHEFAFEASGLTSKYQQFSSENDTAYELRARGRLDVTRRTSLDAEVSSIFAQESRNSVEFGGDANGRSNERSDVLAVGVRHRFNRLEVGLRGRFSDNDLDARERDFLERSLVLRAGYDLQDGFTLLADATWSDQDYDLERDLTGVARSSDGFAVRGGVRFDNGSKLRGVVMAGYQEQTPEDALLSKVRGAVVEAEVDWQVSALTDVRLEASSQIDGSTFGLTSGVLDHELRARLNHAFLRNLRVAVGVEANWRDFQGIDLKERELTGIVEGEWLLNRWIGLSARYEHRDFMSTDADRDYQENRGRIGIRIRR